VEKLDHARKLLGLSGHADERSVRRAYAQLAKTYRPDTHPKAFAEIRGAYELLMEHLEDKNAKGDNLEDKKSAKGEKAVSYIVMAKELGSFEEDVPNTNPLQHIEDQCVQAIKALKPADVAGEANVVRLMDEYVAASARHSRSLRDYVERFLIGTCLGDYYIPHALRERAADLCGLGKAVVVEHRLKPWQREFLLRFDESEVLTGLLKQSNERGGSPEAALVHGAGYSDVLMHRLNRDDTRAINRWMRWLDETFGRDADFVNDEFRKRWKKLEQVEPISSFTLCLFAAFMAASGMVLNALGVPLHQFFQMPLLSMAAVAGGLAVLSWANFMLLVLAKPVYREVQHRIMKFTLARFSKSLLVTERLTMTLLILGCAFASGDIDALGSPVVVGCGLVFVVLAFISRAGGWLDRLPFWELVWRVSVYYLLVSVVYELFGALSWANAVWLMVALVVISLRTRPLMHWREVDDAGQVKGVFAFRLQKARYSMMGLRVSMGVIGFSCLVVGVLLGFLGDGWGISGVGSGLSSEFGSGLSSGLSSGASAILLWLVALELSLNGGIHSHAGAKSVSYQRVKLVGVLVFFSLIVVRLHYVVEVIPALQVCVAVFLVYGALNGLAPRVESSDAE